MTVDTNATIGRRTVQSHPFAVYTADASIFVRHATISDAYDTARDISDRDGVDVRIADDHGLTAIVVAR